MRSFILLFLYGIISLCAPAQNADTINISNNSLNIHFGVFQTKYYSNEMIISKKEFKSLLFTDENAKAGYRKGSTYCTFGYIVGIPSLILLFNQLENVTVIKFVNGQHIKPSIHSEIFIGSIVGTASGILLEYIGKKKIKNSINLFNSEHVKTSFMLKADGVGLVLNF